METKTRQQAVKVDHSIGLTPAQVSDLAKLVSHSSSKVPVPPILGSLLSLRATLMYLRTNLSQAAIADLLGVSQPTISRAIAAMVDRIAQACRQVLAVAEDLPPGDPYLVDGTLIPCWRWRSQPELYSGKHKRAGFNLQVVANLSGTLVWASDPAPGSMHDITVLHACGVLEGHPHHLWIADKGYTGHGLTTPEKKPRNGKLSPTQKENNKTINRYRAPIERLIAQLKTWRILHTGYRRPTHTIKNTITAILAIHTLYHT